MNEHVYFSEEVEAAGHSPIYKMHKYFARRPHNVFRALIEHYSPLNGVVFDCFSGGGVTLIEGLTVGRRVVSYDVNPIASFVQYGQALNIDPKRFKLFSKMIQDNIRNRILNAYQTTCRYCENDADVRWFEHAYLVQCPKCQQNTLLGNENKNKSPAGKEVNGIYTCQNCNKDFRSSDVKRVGSQILDIRYRCDNCGKHETVQPTPGDHAKLAEIVASEESYVKKYHLYIPKDEIPKYWDRQREDCLSRKGFVRFRDLFTVRNAITSAMYFSVLEEMRPKLQEDEYYFLLMNISALLRYTNNMTFSVNSWMDGRPVAWAKHAYWTPNQFVECNPIEYFEKRIKASLSGIKDQNSRFKMIKHATIIDDVLDGNATHIIINGSSSKTDLPSSSVDLVLTDPPYGSNVQYGELCHFWMVWLKNKLPFPMKLFNLNDEVVVHRKPDSGTGYAKNFVEYRLELTEIFKECYRVLKDNGFLVFTFNNRNAHAWYAVIKATIDAGFIIEPGGIKYQDQIDAYRDTAHQRFKGKARGDFIYAFRKTRKTNDILHHESIRLGKLDSIIKSAINDFVKKRMEFTEAELFVAVMEPLLISVVKLIIFGASESDIVSALEFSKVKDKLSLMSNIKYNNGIYYID